MFGATDPSINIIISKLSCILYADNFKFDIEKFKREIFSKKGIKNEVSE